MRRGSTAPATRSSPRRGKPIDNLGRRVNERGRARSTASGEGAPRPRRPAAAAGAADEALPGGDAREYGIGTQVDGGWYRCCGGQVRKLVDCCSSSDKRINGDAALEGYCYSGRKVFCVMYFDTNVPC